jgi:hypothetical protein
MSFFDRRKGDERRSDGSHTKENKYAFNGPEKRKGKDRRSWKDRRLDLYHQMENSRRRAIYQIIEMMEKDVKS